MLPILLKDKKSQKLFIFFLKNVANEGVKAKITSGSKDMLHILKKVVANTFKVVKQQEDKYPGFLKEFLEVDTIDAAVANVRAFKDEKGDKTVRKYFGEETNAIKYINPIMLKIVVKEFCKEGVDYLIADHTNIPNLIQACFAQILYYQKDKDSGVMTQLYKTVISLVDLALEHSQKIEKIEYIFNNKLLVEMAELIDYPDAGMQDTKFTKQQKSIIEIYLKMLELYEKSCLERNCKLDLLLGGTKLLSMAKRGREVLQ